MNTYSDVAYLFLKWAYEEGEIVSNLKMQKLLYYAQAWHLVFFKKPLFEENIEAWELGPVISEAYQEFKTFRNGSLDYELTGTEEDSFTKSQLEYLKECYSTFIRFSAHQLVNMTHNEKPWKDAFRRGSSSVISHQAMKDYYSKMKNK